MHELKKAIEKVIASLDQSAGNAIMAIEGLQEVYERVKERL